MRILCQVLESIAAHARQTQPLECCGILMARGGAGLSTVNCVLRAENAETDDLKQGYVLGHRAHIRAVEMESAGGVRIAGYYHSHPCGGIKPSRRDAELAVGGVSYLIVEVNGSSVMYGSWRLEGHDLVPEPVEVIE